MSDKSRLAVTKRKCKNCGEPLFCHCCKQIHEECENCGEDTNE